MQPPVLPYPDPKFPYLLDTDASAEVRQGGFVTGEGRERARRGLLQRQVQEVGKQLLRNKEGAATQ